MQRGFFPSGYHHLRAAKQLGHHAAVYRAALVNPSWWKESGEPGEPHGTTALLATSSVLPDKPDADDRWALVIAHVDDLLYCLLYTSRCV